MKFLTLVSIQVVLSVIPNVTYIKLKLIVMLFLNKNMARFVQKCCTWLHSQNINALGIKFVLAIK